MSLSPNVPHVSVSERAPDFGLARGRAENTRSVSVSPASAGGPHKEHVMVVEQGICTVTTASCRPPHPAVGRGTSHDRMSRGRTGFGRPRAGAADTGCCRWLARAPPGDLGHQGVRRSSAAGFGQQEYFNDEAEGGTGCGDPRERVVFTSCALPGSTTAGVVSQRFGVLVAGGAPARPARAAAPRCSRAEPGPRVQTAALQAHRKRGTQGKSFGSSGG
jgi:hypothetical protein